MGEPDMRITYDASVDAAYFYFAKKTEPPETRRVDDDIYIDFNAQNQIVGIEVLDASKRLPLSELMPLMERIDTDWVKLIDELQKRKDKGEPVKVSKRTKLWVEEIGLDYIVLSSEGGELRKITARQLLSLHPDDPVIETLRGMVTYRDHSISIKVSQE
jgi:uncharacterized protein YuzE